MGSWDFNKCLKSGCALAPINSTNKNIVVEKVLFSLIASLVKTYVSLKATRDLGFNLVSQLKLHKSFQFRKLFEAFITSKKSTIYQIIKELTDYVRNHCLRTPPSKRDARLLKDQPTLIKAILECSDHLNIA